MEAVIKLMDTRRNFPDLRLFGGFALFLLFSLPFCRDILEASLIRHMLVQIPLLTLVGWFLGRSFFISTFPELNRNGVPGLLVALFATMFWMIPRWLDAALGEIFWEAVKFVTVPLFIGIPLGISWPRMSPFTRAVVWANAISMLVFMGWLYIAAPVRVCNNYLINQQEEFGYAVFALAGAIALYWVGVVFCKNWKDETEDDMS